MQGCLPGLALARVLAQVLVVGAVAVAVVESVAPSLYRAVPVVVVVVESDAPSLYRASAEAEQQEQPQEQQRGRQRQEAAHDQHEDELFYPCP